MYVYVYMYIYVYICIYQFNFEAHTPFLGGLGNIDLSSFNFPFEEPENALSIPTWAIHFSSVFEWIFAMGLVWDYSEVSKDESWKVYKHTHTHMYTQAHTHTRTHTHTHTHTHTYTYICTYTYSLSLSLSLSLTHTHTHTHTGSYLGNAAVARQWPGRLHVPLFLQLFGPQLPGGATGRADSAGQHHRGNRSPTNRLGQRF